MKNISNVSLLAIAIVMISISGMVSRYRLENKVKQLQSNQVKIEKRINNLTQSMQTKDKELEAGMRNNYTGLMYKIEFIEREMGVSE